ncbi:MAG: hypothetical protein ABIR11_00960, partial [Candidatus Limnocylindrales bacterium]
GTVTQTIIVSSAPLQSASAVKTATVTARCATGHALLSGGGSITTTDTPDKIRVIASYPSAADTWTFTGSSALLKGRTWTIRAYVVCAG